MTKCWKTEILLIATKMALSIIGAQAGTRMHPAGAGPMTHQAQHYSGGRYSSYGYCRF